MRPSSPFSRSTLHYPKSTRAYNMSRLLDPSYSTPLPSYSPTVFVDDHGDLHDPDYRDFSLLPTKRAPHSRAQCPRHSTRPAWEFASTFPVDNEYDEENENEDTFPDTSFPTSSCRHSACTYPAGDYRATPFSYRYTYNSSPESSFPTSFTSNNATVSDDDASFFSSLIRRRATSPKLESERKHAKKTRVARGKTAQTAGGDADAEKDESDGDDSVDWTPTCNQLMLRQWYSISIRVRLGIFSVQRKLRKYIPGL